MNLTNREILLKANACVTAGDYAGFLSWCTDDVIWEFVGDKTLSGKEAVRAYMKTAYIEPPEFNIEMLMPEGDLLSSIGKITMKDKSGRGTLMLIAMLAFSKWQNGAVESFCDQHR